MKSTSTQSTTRETFPVLAAQPNRKVLPTVFHSHVKNLEWATEAESRIKAFESGQIEAFDATEVFQRLENKYGK